MTSFVLVHSPLTGPKVWEPVARVLRRTGHEAVVAELSDTGDEPYWQRHARSAAIVAGAAEPPLLLVGHSGAGPILPAIGARVDGVVAGYVFVDAGMPRDGASRMDELDANAPAIASELRAVFDAGGRFPDWRDADLLDEVPDDALRAALVDGLRPRGQDYFTEPIEVPAGWAAVGGAYLRWTESYAPAAAEAASMGWHVVHREAGHFDMLVRPQVVAEELVALAATVQAG